MGFRGCIFGMRDAFSVYSPVGLVRGGIGAQSAGLGSNPVHSRDQEELDLISTPVKDARVVLMPKNIAGGLVL